VNTVLVQAHELSGRCSVERPTMATLALTALGPFPITPDVPVRLVPEGDQELQTFYPETIGVQATSADLDPEVIGYTDHRREDSIDVLLWPRRSACPLTAPGTSYPGDGGGQALGFSAESGVALIAGEDATDGRAQSAFSFNVETGLVTEASAEHQLETTLAYATITPFEDGLLVAGGEDPVMDVDPADRVRSSAGYFYQPLTGAFDPNPIDLLWDRSRHAAVALQNGATLLVSGLARGGLVKQLQAVFPGTRQHSIVGLAALEVGRLEPTALLLDDGRILVGGGQFENGNPVGQVEWFSANASESRGSLPLPPRPNRAFFALPGGGALSVPGCVGAASSCAPWEGTFITPDLQAHPFAMPATTGCPIPERPLLVPGGVGGTPLLIASYPNAPTCVWRFNPWPGAAANGADPLSQPRFEPYSLELEPPPDARTRPLATGPSSFVWISQAEPGVHGVRLDARGAFTYEVDSLTAPDEVDRFRPKYLVPDRPLSVDAGEPRPYDSGALELRESDAGVVFWVTETRFGDVTMTFELDRAASGSDPREGPPVVVFGATPVGDASCPWPPPAGNALPDGELATVVLARRGATVTLSNGKGSSVRCAVPEGMTPIGFGLGALPIVVRGLTIERQ